MAATRLIPVENARRGFAGIPFAVTPSDIVEFTYVSEYFTIGGAGDIYVIDALTGASIKYTVVAGQTIVCQAKRVHSTGTTATNIVGHYAA